MNVSIARLKKSNLEKFFYTEENIMSKMIFECVFGSQLYGTSTPSSDTDYKGVFLPDAKQIIMGTTDVYHRDTGKKGQANTAEDTDREYFSLKKFIYMASKGETATIDMLHTPSDKVIISSGVFDFVRENRQMFYTTKMQAYLGYVRKQASKYGVKGTRLSDLESVISYIERVPDEALNYKLVAFFETLPKSEFTFVGTDTGKDGQVIHFYEVLGRRYLAGIRFSEFVDQIQKIGKDYGERVQRAKTGVDWKAVSHAIRGAEQLLEIYQTGDLQFPLKNAKFITEVKLGQHDYLTVVQPYLEEIMDKAEFEARQAEKNGLRSEVDKKFWDDFVFDVYKDIVVKGD